MQRQSNVSVARLYDWSEQLSEEWLSVSRLYREIAGGAGGVMPRNLPEKPHPGAGPCHGSAGGPVGSGAGAAAGVGVASQRLNPGRMFLRDKGMMTKGEREIIQGIYKNRGDLKKHSSGQRLDLFVRSHHDAWLVGKPGFQGKSSTDVLRESPPVDVTAPTNHSSASESSRAHHADGNGHAGDRDDRRGHQSHTTCVMCLREQQLLRELQQQQLQQKQLKQQQQEKQQKQLQRLRKGKATALPLTNALRPINANEAFKPRGEEMGPPESTPAPLPSSKSTKDSVSKSLPAKQSSSSSPALGGTTGSTSMSATGMSRPLQRRQDASGLPDESYLLPDPDPPHCDPSLLSHSDGEDSESSRRKVHVKVYLPQVGSESVVEDDAKAPRAWPALARERPLSHSDLRKDKTRDRGGDSLTRQPAAEDPGQHSEGGKGPVQQTEVNGEKVAASSLPLQDHHPQKTDHNDSSSVKVKDDRRQCQSMENDNSKVSYGRVALHTHNVTILRAVEGENR